MGRCCNYEMAVWERKGEDKAILERMLLEETDGGSERRIRKVGFERRGRDFFGQHRRKLGTSVEGSLAVLVIFRCV